MTRKTGLAPERYRMPAGPVARHLRRLGSLAGALLAGAALIQPLPALAQDYPSHDITFVVGYAAGGTGDVVARIIGEKLSRSLGKPVVVDNRAGASGSIAAQHLVRSPADGHTILVGQTAEIAINPHLVKGLAYDPAKDMQPIALAAIVPLGLVAPADAPYSSVQELIAAAGKSPNGLSFASAGIGTPGHFAGEVLKRGTGSNLVHVPYKGGGPALNDILGGHVDLYFSGLPPAIQHVRAGKMKLLAVSSGKRLESLPDVPTVAEAAGIKDFDIALWIGFFAPKGTPAPVVERLNTEINAILALPEVKERFAKEGAEISLLSTADFTAFTQAESAKYKTLIAETGVKME